jgi:hypothetical protein
MLGRNRQALFVDKESGSPASFVGESKRTVDRVFNGISGRQPLFLGRSRRIHKLSLLNFLTYITGVRPFIRKMKPALFVTPNIAPFSRSNLQLQDDACEGQDTAAEDHKIGTERPAER